MQCRFVVHRFAFIIGTLVWPCASWAGVAQYDFNGDLNSTTGQAPLGAQATTGSPQVAFESAQINGETAAVAHFSRGTYFEVLHGFPPNGGGGYVNQYTLIMDVMFPDRSPSGGWASLYQTNCCNQNDGDWFVNDTGGIGISGNYGGAIQNGEWHRLALVVDLAAGTFTSFIDGAQVQQNTGEGLDGRFALYSPTDTDSDPYESFFIFADESGDDAEGYVNSVQFRAAALTAAAIAALGGPSAAGIPVPGNKQLAGDCNQDGGRDISDVICYLKLFFPGFFLLDRTPPPAACGDNTGILAVLDVNGDAQLNLSDAIGLAQFIFLGSSPPAQGAGCFEVPLAGECLDNPACR